MASKYLHLQSLKMTEPFIPLRGTAWMIPLEPPASRDPRLRHRPQIRTGFAGAENYMIEAARWRQTTGANVSGGNPDRRTERKHRPPLDAGSWSRLTSERVSPDKRQQMRQPGSSKPARRDPSSRRGTRKNYFGKGPRTTVHFQRRLLGRGQSPYATARLWAPEGR